MPWPELEAAASRGCRCRCKCGRRREQEARTLRGLLGLCFLVMFILALPVLYFLGRRIAGKPAQEEMPSERTPEMQRLQAIPACSCSDPNTWPRIHVSAKNQPHSDSSTDECDDKKRPALHWQNIQEDNPGPGKIKLDNEVYLIVPKDGMYFVYSQVTFYCPNGSCKNISYCGKKAVDEIIVAQMISLQTAAYDEEPVVLFSSTRSIGKQKWKESLYVAGTILLKEGDKLMVNVRNPMLVHKTKPDFTFFGAYLIS